MAQLTSLLDFDQDDLHTVVLAAYGWSCSSLTPTPVRHRMLLFFSAERPDLYVAAHVAAAAAGVQLIDVPERRWRLSDGFATGLIDGVVTAGSVDLPPDLRSLPLLSLERDHSAPIDVLAHIVPWYARTAGSGRGVAAVGDNGAYCWAAATADLPLDVIHTGVQRVSSDFLTQLAAEGQEGSFRSGSAPAHPDIDARTAPSARTLASVIAACLEWVLA